MPTRSHPHQPCRFPSRRTVLMGAGAAGLLSAMPALAATPSVEPTLPPLLDVPLPVPTPRRSFSFDIVALGLVLGRHDVRIEGSDNAFTVHHRIFAEVKPLGVTLFIFDHESAEHFVDGRLVDLQGRTREGDSTFLIEGEAIGDEFEVRGRKSVHRAPADIMVGSFWSPVTLSRALLIEPKKGRLRQSVVHAEERVTDRVAGDTLTFTRYHVSGVLTGQVDYDDNQQWIGCAFKTKGAEVVYRPVT